MRFPERRRRRCQNGVAVGFDEAASTSRDQASRAAETVMSWIRRFSVSISGSAGLRRRMSSLCDIKGTASRGTPGTKSRRNPVGMWCLEAVKRTRRNTFSPESQDVGGLSRANSRSDSSLKPRQSASLKFWKGREGREGGMESRRVRRMGR